MLYIGSQNVSTGVGLIIPLLQMRRFVQLILAMRPAANLRPFNSINTQAPDKFYPLWLLSSFAPYLGEHHTKALFLASASVCLTLSVGNL